jgi:hypothetical protein
MGPPTCGSNDSIVDFTSVLGRKGRRVSKTKRAGATASYLSAAQSAAAVAISMLVRRPTPVSSFRWS